MQNDLLRSVKALFAPPETVTMSAAKGLTTTLRFFAALRMTVAHLTVKHQTVPLCSGVVVSARPNAQLLLL